MTHRPLTTADLQLHERLGITPAMLDRMQVHRVTDQEARELLALTSRNGSLAGVAYPYFDPHSGRIVAYRIRRDVPEFESGKPRNKYLSGYGDRKHFYFVIASPAALQDTTCPVILVESEKAALAVACAAERRDRSIVVIALGGCWGWRGRIGKVESANGGHADETGVLPDVNHVTWTSRDAVILFDANASTNSSVQAARRQLARELRARGADVRQATLPDHDPRINGPDDLIGICGDAALWRVIDGAVIEDFRRSESHQIIANDIDNIRLALARLGLRVQFDEFAREIIIDGVTADDVMLDRLWVRFYDTFRFHPSKATLYTVLVDEAHQLTVHPVRQYLDALTWDGIQRLDGWLVTYAGADDSAYVSAVGALPLVAAVRRVRYPGCKFDELLVIESKQGTLKSSALRTLCADPDWFSDDLPLGTDSKQVIERTAGKWLLEAAELYGHRGREVEQLKTFLSRQIDGPVRLAYGRLPVSVPRQFVMIGTTNGTAYLKDSTGARRFWPVQVHKFDLDALASDRDQLWAEAAMREAIGISIRLDQSIWADAAQEQEDRRAVDPWEELLRPTFDGDGVTRPERVAVADIWTVLGMAANQMDNRHADRVAAIAQRFGFRRKERKWRGGRRGWEWVREEDRTDQGSRDEAVFSNED